RLSRGEATGGPPVATGLRARGPSLSVPGEVHHLAVFVIQEPAHDVGRGAEWNAPDGAGAEDELDNPRMARAPGTPALGEVLPAGVFLRGQDHVREESGARPASAAGAPRQGRLVIPPGARVVERDVHRLLAGQEGVGGAVGDVVDTDGWAGHAPRYACRGDI